jgi:phosphatidylinositol glycan class M
MMWSHIVNLIGFLVRLYLIITISAGDNYYEGEYSIFTDLDYKVYLDASLYDNPYDRHTYRYSPILAFLMSPSYTLHQNFGKIVIALFDVIACYFIPKLFETRKFRSEV